MSLKDKLEKASELLFIKSHDIEKSPDMCGLLYDNPLVGREALTEVLALTEKAFIRITFFILGNTVSLAIHNIKNNTIVTIDNMKIASADLADLKEAYQSHPQFSFGFGIFKQEGGRMVIYPVTQHEIILTIKSWEIIAY
jgi:hypothetical protein